MADRSIPAPSLIPTPRRPAPAFAVGIVAGICLLNIISMQWPDADARALKFLILINYVVMIGFHLIAGGIPRSQLLALSGYFLAVLAMTGLCRGDLFATLGFPIIAGVTLLATFEKPRFVPSILMVLRIILGLSLLTAVAPFGHTDYDDGVFPWRVNGIAGHANGLGGYALLTWMVDDMLRNRWLTKTKLLVVVVLVVSQSKTAAMLIPCYHLLKWALPDMDRRPHLLMALYAAVFTVLCVFSANYTKGEYSVSESGFTGRTILWKAAMAKWESHQLFGVGMGAMWKDPEALAMITSETTYIPSYSHNLYIQYLTETGLFGVTCFGAMLAYCLTRISTRGCFIAACLIFLYFRGLSEVPFVFWPYSDNFLQVFILLSITWKGTGMGGRRPGGEAPRGPAMAVARRVQE